MFLSFKDWLLEKGNSINTVNSICSRINRIKEEYSIEYEFNKDNCIGLINEFTYTTEDMKIGVVPKAHINISGDYLIGLRSLRRALILYTEYLGTSTTKTKARCSYKSAADTKESCIIECSFSEFNRYTGASWRNKVQIITKTLKKQIAACECCGKSTELHAAHRRGFERIDIIKNILINNYKVSDDRYKVNLEEFEQKFIDAHKPFENMFYFLCQDCHRIYDGDDVEASDKILSSIIYNRSTK